MVYQDRRKAILGFYAYPLLYTNCKQFQNPRVGFPRNMEEGKSIPVSIFACVVRGVDLLPTIQDKVA